MFEQMTKKGLLLSLATAVLWGLYTVLMKFGAVHFENLNPFVFILQAYLVGSLTLLVFSGPGLLAKDTLTNYYTWFYGIFNLLNNAFLVTAFYYSISAASVTLLVRFGIIISLLFDIYLIKNVKIKNKIFYLTLFFGLIIVICGVTVENPYIPIGLVFMSALMQVSLLKLAEKHKQNNQATGSIRSELRVSGFMAAASSLVFMVFIFIMALSGLDFKYIVPTVPQLLDLNSLIYASLVGFFVISLSKYLVLISTKTAGTTNFLTIIALTPVFTILVEYIFIKLELFPVNKFSIYEMVGGVIIVSSALLLAIGSIKQTKN